MKKLAYLLVAAAVVSAILVAVLYRVPGVQDAVLKRALAANFSRQPPSYEGLNVVICGSASPLGNDPARAQACVAVVTPEHFFLFDAGARSPLRVAQAQLPVGRLSGIFLTHFHSDHIAALPDINLVSWVRGRRESLPIYGPPGVTRVVGGFNTAYGLDFGYRVTHHGPEMLPPPAGPMTPHRIQPEGVVWSDEKLTVTAFKVNHAPVSPAVGYRVDYGGRSVVISGDSVVSAALFEAAEGADLLLHDALSRALLDPMIAATTAADVQPLPALMTDVIDYHADTLALAERAAQAGIGQLALYHLVPAPVNALAERVFRRGLPDDVLLVKDLDHFRMPLNGTDMQFMREN